MARERILIVDDVAGTRNALAERLRAQGYAVDTAADGFKALPKLAELAPDAVVTGLKLPGMSGLELTARTRERDPECIVIVLTAFATVDSAVQAMKLGAADYITKPVDVDKLLGVLAREIDRKRVRAATSQQRARPSDNLRVKNLIGSSPAMQQAFASMLRAAPSRVSVLLTGESGTGKESMAAALHEHSPRVKGPFVKLHCEGPAQSLLEVELFGHEPGAFGGAIARRPGKLEQAAGGTLFLDEITVISPAIQLKLLRFLQEHELERIGGSYTIELDVRVVTATNRDLLELVGKGLFREDLYYHLSVVSIELPPLRARQSDIAQLAWYFLSLFAREQGKEIGGFTEAALTQLATYDWPGNVRELKNAVERAVLVCSRDRIDVDDLAPAFTAGERYRDRMPPIPGAKMAELERYAILKTLEQTGGSTSRAAEMLGISPRTIQYRLQQYDTGVPKS